MCLRAQACFVSFSTLLFNGCCIICCLHTRLLQKPGEGVLRAQRPVKERIPLSRLALKQYSFLIYGKALKLCLKGHCNKVFTSLQK